MVKLASKLTFGAATADWQERINVARMREQRAERARRIMKKLGIAAMLEARMENIRYLTGVIAGFRVPQLTYVLFPAEGEPVMFAHAGYYHQLPDQEPWIKHWRIARSWLGGICGPEAAREEARLFAAEVHRELRDRGLAGEQLALGGFDSAAWEALRQHGLRLVDDSPLLLEAKAIKNQDEINCHKMVAAIVDGAWYAVWQALKPGIRDTDLCRVVAEATYGAGAEDTTAGGWYSGPTTFDRGFQRPGRILQVGDLVYGALCGVTYLGYRSCSYRTFIIGRKPNDQEKDWYKRMLERLDGVIDAIKPGATTADAAQYFAPADAWGYADEVELLTMEIGHGIGIGPGYDMPVINRQWSLTHPQVFEPGMTIAVEGREGVPRVGGVRLEDMVVVTQNGAELMDHFPRDEMLVAAEL